MKSSADIGKIKVLQGLNLLDQVEDWLELRRDPETVSFVERRLGG